MIAKVILTFASMTTAGIYIHIPFCKSRCSYCDFATGLSNADLAERYVAPLEIYIQSDRKEDFSTTVDSIYFGGGTPSMLAASQIERLLEAVHQRFQIESAAEITMEINPGS